MCVFVQKCVCWYVWYACCACFVQGDRWCVWLAKGLNIYMCQLSEAFDVHFRLHMLHQDVCLGQLLLMAGEDHM